MGVAKTHSAHTVWPVPPDRRCPVISRKGCPDIKGLGELRYAVEQAFALLHHFNRFATRRERRTELHVAFVSLACSLICWRRLKKTTE